MFVYSARRIEMAKVNSVKSGPAARRRRQSEVPLQLSLHLPSGQNISRKVVDRACFDFVHSESQQP